MPIEIILIRHGETVYNSEHRIQGRLDSALTAKGEEQVRLTGQFLAQSTHPIQSWWVSPQGRARQSSQIIRDCFTTSLPPESIHDGLREINCGQFEGQVYTELDSDYVHYMRQHPEEPYPEGESMLDVMARAGRFLADWRNTLPEIKKAEVVRSVVVAHGNLLRALSAVLLDLGVLFMQRSVMDNAAINRFRALDNRFQFQLSTYNQTSHLHSAQLYWDS